jgi:hypothetical protein
MRMHSTKKTSVQQRKHHQHKETAYAMGENLCQLFNWKGIKIQNIQWPPKKKTPKESTLILALLICN